MTEDELVIFDRAAVACRMCGRMGRLSRGSPDRHRRTIRFVRSCCWRREAVHAAEKHRNHRPYRRGGSDFDHAAFDAKSRRVFIAHTARDCIEVIDPMPAGNLATLLDFRGVAGAVADDGQILVTNRGSASVALLDAGSLESAPRSKAAGAKWCRDRSRVEPRIAACIGVTEKPDLAVVWIERSQAWFD